MTKDGLSDKFERQLHEAYDRATEEPIPEEFKELLAKLK